MKLLQLALTALILALPLSAQQDSAVSLTIRFVDGTSRDSRIATRGIIWSCLLESDQKGGPSWVSL